MTRPMPTADPSPRLVPVERGDPLSLPAGPAVVGRDPACDLRIDDPDVSRRHARVEVRDDGVLVEDLGSKNGTTVDGEPVEGAVLARPGATVSFGGPAYRVHHPTAEVTRMLADAGEPTVTRIADDARAAGPSPRSLVVPALVAVILAVVLASVLW